jgi:hypothetical protein
MDPHHTGFGPIASIPPTTHSKNHKGDSCILSVAAGMWDTRRASSWSGER